MAAAKKTSDKKTAQASEASPDNKAQKHEFSAEISRVLKLMIHSLYTNKDIFLRELISNASDACDKLRYQALTKPELLGKDSELNITLTSHEKNNTLTVTDNGIGMNRDDLIANLGTIAKSGTGEFLENLSGDAKKDSSLIGQFGVGFYSAYMVANKVEVISRKAGEKQAWKWVSAGEGEYEISAYDDAEFNRGTRITLYLRDDAKDYADKHRISHIAQTYSDHISFPIHYLNEEGETLQINSGAALWTRSQGDITPEQYKEFYAHVAHQPDEPWAVLHNKIEGNLSYTNLLFIPTMPPFDLFNQERRRRVKLYVKRVFITDENVEVIPAYLRFLRGVVDSEDLPLNISRETLQHNPMLQKISEAITKKVLTTLKKKSEKEPESYVEFWKHFGAVLKEGLCESIAPKEKILEACLFETSDGQQMTLDAYIEAMEDKQQAIYFLAGEKLESLRHHPQLEGFKKHNISVILLHDHVDDFWVNVVNDYKGKSLRSIVKFGSDLDAFSEKEVSEKDKEKDEKSESKIADLIEHLKNVYGEEVRDVRTTAKLSESPVCLAVGQGDMDIRMERFLRENKQLPSGAQAKILEINPEHPVIIALAESVKNNDSKAKDMAWLLLDQARIIEGEEVGDIAEFSRRLTSLLLNAAA